MTVIVTTIDIETGNIDFFVQIFRQMNQRLRGEVSRFFHRMELTNRRDDEKEEEKEAEETSDGSAALPRFHFYKMTIGCLRAPRALKIFRGVCLTFC